MFITGAKRSKYISWHLNSKLWTLALNWTHTKVWTVYLFLHYNSDSENKSLERFSEMFLYIYGFDVGKVLYIPHTQSVVPLVNAKANYILIMNWLIYLYNEIGQCVRTMFLIADILFLKPWNICMHMKVCSASHRFKHTECGLHT